MSQPSVIRVLDEADLDELDASLAVAFGEVPSGAKERVAAQLRAQLQNTLGSFQNGRLVSSARMYPFAMYVGGTRVRVGGLAGVATEPWARRRGHVARLLQVWLERLHDDGVAWCAEHPFDPRFYARYGFQSLPNGRVVQVPPSYFAAGRPSDAERVTGPGLSSLAPIHHTFASRYSFALSRDDAARDGWGRVTRAWSGEDRHAYLLEDAYVVFGRFHETTEPLRVSDFAWASPQGRARVHGFLRAFEGQVEKVRIHLPPGDAVLLDATARHALPTPLVQVRMVDVGKALEPLMAPRASRWRLRLQDDDCAWNRGVFDMQLGPDGCHVEAGDGPADAGLHVRDMVALLAGAATPEVLLADGRAEGDPRALHALGELMRGAPTFQAEIDDF